MMSEPLSDKSCGQCVCAGAGPELSRVVKQALDVPDNVSQHFRNASVEVLKGLRELLDHRIEKLTKPEETRGTKVSVD
jgi:hypothetical protein